MATELTAVQAAPGADGPAGAPEATLWMDGFGPQANIRSAMRISKTMMAMKRARDILSFPDRLGREGTPMIAVALNRNYQLVKLQM